MVGPYSCYWDPGNAPFNTPDGENRPLVYGAQLAAPVSLAGMTSLKLWLGLGSRYFFNHHPRGRTRVHIYYKLTDTSGNTLQWSVDTGAAPRLGPAVRAGVVDRDGADPAEQRGVQLRRRWPPTS